RLCIAGRGDVFGEPFWKDPHRMSHASATIRALTYCDLHCIKKDCMLQVLEFYSAFANSFARNLVLTYDLKTRLIFRKWVDVKREQELAEQRRPEVILSEIRADHPVRRMIHRFRQIGSNQQQSSKEQLSRHDSPLDLRSDEEDDPGPSTTRDLLRSDVPSRRNSTELAIGVISRKFEQLEVGSKGNKASDKRVSKAKHEDSTQHHNEVLDYLNKLRENMGIISRQIQGVEDSVQHLQVRH
ncbi:Potassium voltage-gated channel subfamily H member 5, partial [Cichlidogyrus casuarinus]